MQKGTIAKGVCSVGVVIALVLGMTDAPLRTNRAGLELIGGAESCRFAPYKCPAGLWTDGVGNTIHDVTPGVAKTYEQIAKDWAANIRTAEQCVLSRFNGAEMSGNQFSAMTSAAFRLGCGGLSTYRTKDGRRVTTTIRQLALKGQFVQMCERLTDFSKGGGQVLPGLVIRGQKERALCLTPGG